MTRADTPKKAWHQLRVWETWGKHIDVQAQEILKHADDVFSQCDLSQEDQIAFELDIDQISRRAATVAAQLRSLRERVGAAQGR